MSCELPLQSSLLLQLILRYRLFVHVCFPLFVLYRRIIP